MFMGMQMSSISANKFLCFICQQSDFLMSMWKKKERFSKHTYTMHNAFLNTWSTYLHHVGMNFTHGLVGY
jgi:hypothetical protein